MNSDYSEEEEKSSENELMSDFDGSDYSQEQVFPIDDYSEDELEKQLEDFKKFNSKKLIQENEEDDEQEIEEEGWGKSRRDYYGQSESEEDEGEEGIKIQKAQLSKIREEDFYGEFDEEEESKKVEKKIQKLETFDTEKFNHQLVDAVKLLQNGDYDPDYLTLKFLYLTNLSFYYSLVNGPEHENRMSHPVVKRIEELGAILEQVGSRVPYFDESEDSNDEAADQEETGTQEMESLEEEMGSEDEVIDEMVQDDSEPEMQVENIDGMSDFDEEYEPIMEKKIKSKPDEFGEIEELNEVDLQDKNNRRKALNFRVSQVEQSLIQKSHQRGGDDDIPFKTKVKKDYSREQEEMSPSASEDDFQSDEDSQPKKKGPQDDIFGEDEYYQKIKNEKLAKKKEREEKYAKLNEPLVDYYVEPELEGDEKRKATWKILANRGLTPFRKKENRNPRVKKRMKYEKAVKKLPSTRRVAVDKKKLSKYGGELTGIKSNLARSTKF